jgi:hypothetical protein
MHDKLVHFAAKTSRVAILSLECLAQWANRDATGWALVLPKVLECGCPLPLSAFE